MPSFRVFVRKDLEIESALDIQVCRIDSSCGFATLVGILLSEVLSCDVSKVSGSVADVQLFLLEKVDTLKAEIKGRISCVEALGNEDHLYLKIVYKCGDSIPVIKGEEPIKVEESTRKRRFSFCPSSNEDDLNDITASTSTPTMQAPKRRKTTHNNGEGKQQGTLDTWINTSSEKISCKKPFFHASRNATGPSSKKKTQKATSKTATAKTTKCRTPRKPGEKLMQLSQEDRNKLSGIPFDIHDFDTFLRNELDLEDSGSYMKCILHKVNQLMSGKGISNRNWDKGVIFGHKQNFDLSTDFYHLHEYSKSFEAANGSDKGKGKGLRLSDSPFKSLVSFNNTN